jgi:hypothetical protein
MDLRSLRSQVAVARAAMPTPRPHRLTTSENREEFARILAKIESLPAGTPPHPDTTGLAETYAEIDRVIARLEPDGAEPKFLNPIARNSAAQPTE